MSASGSMLAGAARGILRLSRASRRAPDRVHRPARGGQRGTAAGNRAGGWWPGVQQRLAADGARSSRCAGTALEQLEFVEIVGQITVRGGRRPRAVPVLARYHDALLASAQFAGD